MAALNKNKKKIKMFDTRAKEQKRKTLMLGTLNFKEIQYFEKWFLLKCCKLYES